MTAFGTQSAENWERDHSDSAGHDSRGRFRLESFGEIQFDPDPAERVQGLLPTEGVALIWGDRKACKTFLTMDLLLHVAIVSTAEQKGAKWRREIGPLGV